MAAARGKDLVILMYSLRIVRCAVERGSVWREKIDRLLADLCLAYSQGPDASLSPLKLVEQLAVIRGKVLMEDDIDAGISQFGRLSGDD